MKAAFESILFDFDGVVADYGDQHFVRWQNLTKPFGIALSQEYFYSLEGLSSEHIVENIAHNHNLSVPDKLRFREKALNQSRSIQLPRIDCTMKLLLEQLKLASISSALVTGGSKARVVQVLEHYHLADLFEVLIFSDSYKHPKPSPEPYAMACKKLNCPPAKALVIENAELGIQSANSAGCTSYALTSTQSAEQLSQANKIFKSYQELYETLRLQFSLPVEPKTLSPSSPSS